MRDKKSALLSLFFSLVLISVYIVSLLLLEYNRKNSTNLKKNVGIWNLPPIILSLMVGEYRGLVADLLILEAGAKIGTKIERTKSGEFTAVSNDYDLHTIHQMLVASQNLDPYFQQTFMLAQGWLPWDDGLVEETNAIHKIAQKNRNWDFFPTQFMAFNTYYFLNDYKKAGEILLNAASLENAPPHFAIIGSRLSHKGGDTKAAIILLRLIVGSRDNTEPGFENLKKRLEALEGVYILEQAVAKYKSLYSFFPFDPEQLMQNGILFSLPNNPYGFSYCINQSGKVFFDRPNCRKLNQ